tara:strand:- start:215 stop:475 length:261 start_codon:yes stop_codon:yes gene_type:complete
MISRNIYIRFTVTVRGPEYREEIINVPAVKGRYIEDLINVAYEIRALDDDERMDIEIVPLTPPFSSQTMDEIIKRNLDQEDQRLPI